MTTLSVRTPVLRLYEQLTTRKNHQYCKATRIYSLLSGLNLHNFLISSSQRHNSLQIRYVQVGCDPATYQFYGEYQ